MPTMKKPRPSSEVIAIVSGGIIFITTHSRDAREWIEEEARDFGSLLPDSIKKTSHCYILIVDDGYDMNEIQTYLELQGE
jgi:hypothetical protein